MCYLYVKHIHGDSVWECFHLYSRNQEENALCIIGIQMFFKYERCERQAVISFALHLKAAAAAAD